MKSSLNHPSPYVKKQIADSIKNNTMEQEIVWTYLLARKYEKDHKALADKLCGEDKLIPENSIIWLEAPLQPTRQKEGVSWKTRADLAMGHLEKVPGTKCQVQATSGEWVCIAESKWHHDIRPKSTSKTGINQLLRIIEHSLFLHDKKGNFPEKVYVTLVTPRYFKESLGKHSDRDYYAKFTEYQKSDKLKKGLTLCPLPFLEHDLDTLISRISVLTLNWVTFEEMLGLPNLVEDQFPGKYRVTIASWEKIFFEMGREDLFRELSSETGKAWK